MFCSDSPLFTLSLHVILIIYTIYFRFVAKFMILRYQGATISEIQNSLESF